MIVVLEGNEAKRLQVPSLDLRVGCRISAMAFTAPDAVSMVTSTGSPVRPANRTATSFRDGLQLRPRTAAIIQLITTGIVLWN